MDESRIEAILENILGADNELLEPVSRNEALLIQILEMLKNGAEINATYDNGKVTLIVG